uniref:Uncharacterized protein n=1 Tax=Timema monikensis TaxID=170555 RepID=A0A7R9EN03_9NEOP|nr:unnamed protein product [Timema monikensis]
MFYLKGRGVSLSLDVTCHLATQVRALSVLSTIVSRRTNTPSLLSRSKDGHAQCWESDGLGSLNRRLYPLLMTNSWYVGDTARLYWYVGDTSSLYWYVGDTASLYWYVGILLAYTGTWGILLDCTGTWGILLVCNGTWGILLGTWGILLVCTGTRGILLACTGTWGILQFVLVRGDTASLYWYVGDTSSLYWYEGILLVCTGNWGILLARTVCTGTRGILLACTGTWGILQFVLVRGDTASLYWYVGDTSSLYWYEGILLACTGTRRILLACTAQSESHCICTLGLIIPEHVADTTEELCNWDKVSNDRYEFIIATRDSGLQGLDP